MLKLNDIVKLNTLKFKLRVINTMYIGEGNLIRII